MKVKTKRMREANDSQVGGDGIPRFEEYELPEFDKSKVDDMTLALLYLVVCERSEHHARAWKSFDWDTMNRLHEQGMIDNPVGKAKSLFNSLFFAV